MLPREASVVIGISGGGGGNGGGVGGGTSGCGGKILSWGGKCGLGAIVGVGLVGAVWGLGPVDAGFLSGFLLVLAEFLFCAGGLGAGLSFYGV